MVEKQSYLEYIWIMESIVLDDELSGCVVEEIRGIKEIIPRKKKHELSGVWS